MAQRGGKYLTFTLYSLADEEYAIGIMVDAVSEVLNLMTTTSGTHLHSEQSWKSMTSSAWPSREGVLKFCYILTGF
jgi:hypothetical protein